MPKQYEAIRDSLYAKCRSEGKTDRYCDRYAKTVASKTYNKNKQPGQKPVTNRD